MRPENVKIPLCAVIDLTFQNASFASKLPWLERKLNFLSIGGIIVLFGPTETSEMLFEV